MIVAKENDEIIGGAQGGSVWDWMHIKLLWVKENQKLQKFIMWIMRYF